MGAERDRRCCESDEPCCRSAAGPLRLVPVVDQSRADREEAREKMRRTWVPAPGTMTLMLVGLTSVSSIGAAFLASRLGMPATSAIGFVLALIPGIVVIAIATERLAAEMRRLRDELGVRTPTLIEALLAALRPR